MLRRCCLALFLCLWLSLGITHPASAASREQQKEYRASAFDQDIMVQTDGSLLVNEYMQVQLTFAPGSVIPQASWQLQLRHLLPYLIVPFLLAGMLIVGIGFWLLGRRARRYLQPLPAGTMNWMSVKAPPDNLPPALAAIIARNRPDGPSWNLFLGTVFDLLNRNILAIRETEHAYSWQQEPTRQYWLELLAQPAELLPHEQVLLRVIFKGSKKTMETRIKVHAIRGNYKLHKQWFDSALQQMVREKDWFDPQRSRSRRPYTYSAIILTVLGSAGVILTLILMAHITPYYACLFLLDGPVLILALAAGACSSKHSLVHDQYWPLAWQWQQFSAYLPQVSSISAIFVKSQAEHIDGYFPYAASFGVAQPWAKHFYQPTRNTLPSWFSTQIVDPEQQHRAFMNLLYNSQLIPLPRNRRSDTSYRR